MGKAAMKKLLQNGKCFWRNVAMVTGL